MKNFVLGAIVGIVIAMCCYKPYQIEMQYRRNIATGPNALGPVNCITGVEMRGVAEVKIHLRDGNILSWAHSNTPKSPH
jgi:hypothetical protein